MTLLRFGHLLGEPRYLAAAEGVLRAAWPVLQEYPSGHASLLQALEELLQPPAIVILRGPASVVEAWRRALAQVYAPGRIVLAVPGEGGSVGTAGTAGAELPAALADKPALAGGAGYVCRGSHCSAALTSLDELVTELSVRPDS